MRLGLIASRLHHRHSQAALFRWLLRCESGIRELYLGLDALVGPYDAIERTASAARPVEVAEQRAKPRSREWLEKMGMDS